jgi:hypothetical protein
MSNLKNKILGIIIIKIISNVFKSENHLRHGYLMEVQDKFIVVNYILI